MEALQKLGIDYHYLIIQIVNFGVLFAALTYLLYKPITKMLEKRRHLVEESLKKAEHIDKREKDTEADIEGRLKHAQKEVADMIQEGKVIASKEKARILAEAEAEAAMILARGEARVKEERAQMQAEIRTSVAHIASFVLTQVLKTNMSKDDAQKFVEKAINEFKE